VQAADFEMETLLSDDDLDTAEKKHGKVQVQEEKPTIPATEGDNVMFVRGKQVKWTQDQDRVILQAAKRQLEEPELWSLLARENQHWQATPEDIQLRYERLIELATLKTR